MAVSQATYVQEREGTLYVGETRVTVSGLIAAWRTEGYTPEELQLGFPVLTLAQVYGALAYYLDHEQELDAVFAADDQQYAEQRTRDRAADPDRRRAFARRKPLGVTPGGEALVA